MSTNKVQVIVYKIGNLFARERYETEDINRAMESVYSAWADGLTAKFVGPYGIRYLEPPTEDVVAQLPDDSQARHDRNRARWKSP